MLNLAPVPLKTNESVRSLCLASANASSELQKDLKRLSNFASILSATLLITSSTFNNLTSYKNNLHYLSVSLSQFLHYFHHNVKGAAAGSAPYYIQNLLKQILHTVHTDKNCRSIVQKCCRSRRKHTCHTKSNEP